MYNGGLWRAMIDVTTHMEMHMRALTLLLVVVLSGCATGSMVVTGKTRPPISPEAVKVYTQAPSNHEVVAIVEASSEIGLTRQGAADRAIQYLKEKAASVGANGIVLQGMGRSSNMGSANFINQPGGGFMIGSSDEYMDVKAIAIYVPSSK